jgi:molecular chaperone DnaK (HSP70)
LKKSNYIGIKLFSGEFLPIIKSNEVKTKKVILTTVKDNQKKTVIELYEGSSNNCSENEYLGKLIIPIKRETKKGDPAIEVHLRKNKEGNIFAQALDSESGEKNQIDIEHSASQTILQETDDEKQKFDSDITHLEAYSGDEGKSALIRKIAFIAIVIILAAILSFLVFLGIKEISKLINNNKKAVKIEQPKKEEPKKAPDKKEITGVKDLEGKKHFVRKGDNLWNICKKYYGDPWYYTDLAKKNNIKNTRLIYKGTYITIPDKNYLTRYK